MSQMNRLIVSVLMCAAPTFAAAQSELIEEIIVTAQKRAQSLQEELFAVTAFRGDELAEQRIVQPKHIAAQTPNLLTKNAVGNTAPIFSVRGISLNDFATNGTQPVGVYVDEVYLFNNSQLSFQMFDIERVEALKGPQGTLYGETRRQARSTSLEWPIRLGAAQHSRRQGYFGQLVLFLDCR